MDTLVPDPKLSAATRQRIEALRPTHRLVLVMSGTPNTLTCGSTVNICELLDGIGLDYAPVDGTGDPEFARGERHRAYRYGIPQLYLDGEFVASGDAIEDMANAGELHAGLGLAAPDRRPPEVKLSPAAAKFLRAVIAGREGGVVADIQITAQWSGCVRIEPRRKGTIQTEVDGVPLQFDLASVRRAEGMSIDWQDVERGPDLLLHFPNAPVIEPVRPMSPEQADAGVRDGGLTIVDIRHPQERALARLNLPFLSLDEHNHVIRNLAPDVPLAVLCHHGDRSVPAAEYLHLLGHRDVYYIEGGIEAWAERVDPSIPRY